MSRRVYRIELRKAWIGWWIDGRWCPTVNVRNHEIRRIMNGRPEPVVLVDRRP